MTFPPGSTTRLVYIAAFAVSGYASTKGRTSKPFNPLLGETYELVHQQKVRGVSSRCQPWLLTSWQVMLRDNRPSAELTAPRFPGRAPA